MLVSVTSGDVRHPEARRNDILLIVVEVCGRAIGIALGAVRLVSGRLLGGGSRQTVVTGPSASSRRLARRLIGLSGVLGHRRIYPGRTRTWPVLPRGKAAHEPLSPRGTLTGH